MFVPVPEWIFTLHPPHRVKPGNVKVRLECFSRMNHPRRLFAFAAVFLTTTNSASARLCPKGATTGLGRILES